MRLLLVVVCLASAACPQQPEPTDERPAPPAALSILINGPGSVTADDGAISCPGRCRAVLDGAKTFQLTAVASDGGVFNSWSGGCTGETPTCRLSTSSKTVVTASFDDVTPGAAKWWRALPGEPGLAVVESGTIAPGSKGKTWLGGWVYGVVALGGDAGLTRPTFSFDPGEPFITGFDTDGTFSVARRFPARGGSITGLGAFPDGGLAVVGWARSDVDLGGDLVTNEAFCQSLLFAARFDERLQRTWSLGYGGKVCGAPNGVTVSTDDWWLWGGASGDADLRGRPQARVYDAAPVAARYDGAGGFIREVVVPSGRHSSTSVMGFTSNGTQVMGIDLQPSTARAGRTQLKGFDPMGAERWSVTLGDSDGGLDFTGLGASPDGGFVVCGTYAGVVTAGATTLTASGPTSAFAARFSDEGRVQWFKDLGARSATSLVMRPGGSFMVTGVFFDSMTVDGQTLQSQGGSDVFLASLGGNGDVHWVRGYGAGFTDDFPRIVSNGDDRYVMSAFFTAVDGGIIDLGKRHQVPASRTQSLVFELWP